MIRAFTSRTCVSKSDDINGTTTCLAFSGEMLYVGTKSGDLLMYRYSSEDQKAPATYIKRRRLGNGKKPIVQLEVVEDLNLFWVLCNGKITAHDLRTGAKKQLSVEVKHSISMFCCEKTADPYHLCLSLKGKKKLVVFQYDKSRVLYVPSQTRDLSIPENPITMTWHQTKICLGYKKEYSFLDANYGTVTDVPVPVGEVKPCMQIISHTELLLASNNHIGIFVNFRGDPVPKNTISWTKSPLEMVKCGHHVVALLPNNSIEVISLLDQAVVQTLAFSNGYGLVSDDKTVMAISNNTIITLEPTSVLDQVEQYLTQLYLDEAESLLEKTNPNKRDRSKFHANAGFVSLTSLHYSAAAKHFSKSNIDPREIIANYHDLAKPVPYKPTHPRCPGIRKDISNIIDIGKTNYRSSSRKPYNVLAQVPREDLILHARFFLAQILWERRNNTDPDYILADEQAKICVDTALLMLCVEFTEHSYNLKGMKGLDFINNDSHGFIINTSVSGSIVEAERESKTEGLQFPFNVHQLLQPTNSCLLHASELFLIKRKQYSTLAIVYQSKGEYFKALKVWEQLGNGEYKENPHSSCPVIFNIKKEVVKGLVETVDLLSNLPDSNHLWEFAVWVLEKDPAVGMKVFASDKRETHLPPEKVIKFLSEIKAENEFDFVEAYLEHIISKRGNENPKYHNNLAKLYLKKLMSKEGKATRKLMTKASPKYYSTLNTIKKLNAFLKKSSHYHPNEILSHALNSDLYEEIIVLYEKLNQHNDVLKTYILKLGDHKSAIAYCVKQTKKSRRAALEMNMKNEKKSLYGRNSSASSPPNDTTPPDECFILLLQIYFSSEYVEKFPEEDGEVSGMVVDDDDEDEEPGSYIDRAIHLLTSYSIYIHPVRALKVLNPTIPASKLAVYLSKVIPHTLSKRRHGQVMKGLAKMDNHKTNIRLLHSKSPGFKIEANSVCVQCDKPVGENCIFSAHRILVKDKSHRSLTRPDTVKTRHLLPSQSMFPEPKNEGQKNARYAITHYTCKKAYQAAERKKQSKNERSSNAQIYS